MIIFHEILFPLDIALRARGGPERRTQIQTSSTGLEERNQKWKNSRRRYDAGSGVKSLTDIYKIVSFFEERRGMLHGFRWRDRLDCSSSPLGSNMSPKASDQKIAMGDGHKKQFQLIKSYGALAPYERAIKKPVAGSVRVQIDDQPVVEGKDFSIDATNGILTLLTTPPEQGALICAGYLFDVPVRFDTDYLEVDHSAFIAGEIPKIPLIEILI
ncbi:MAG: TIGR02217 family protein [Alphaproteobacteria bacterium]|nr:TIGR02217 family protein [Alphaproteobacteria bacterium]